MVASSIFLLKLKHPSSVLVKSRDRGHLSRPCLAQDSDITQSQYKDRCTLRSDSTLISCMTSNIHITILF